MATSRDITDMMEDPAFLRSVELIHRALIEAQQPQEDGAPALSATLALDALHFTIALIQEASPGHGMPRALRLAADQSRADIFTMMRMMRDYHADRGQHMLETIGGKVEPTIL